MGWMRSLEPTVVQHDDRPVKPAIAPSVEHIEDTTGPESYRPVQASVPDSELPSIPASTVSASAASERHWIVIDNIICDCTAFALEHPGGDEILKSFRGHDCTWQFRRFHGKQELEQAKPLRVGRTAGVVNKFRERPRFVGLRKFGADWL